MTARHGPFGEIHSRFGWSPIPFLAIPVHGGGKHSIQHPIQFSQIGCPSQGVTPGALEVQCAALQGPDAVRRAARRRHYPSLRETRKFEPFILSDKNK